MIRWKGKYTSSLLFPKEQVESCGIALLGDLRVSFILEGRGWDRKSSTHSLTRKEGESRGTFHDCLVSPTSYTVRLCGG